LELFLASAQSPASSGPSYVGRFAPSPTGPLHFGSLVAAVGSYLDARAAGGRWLVRIEDIDRPREVRGSADAILRALEEFGFEWDGPVEKQSRRLQLYEDAIATLDAQGQLFACSCSRSAIATLPGEEARYPGTCRNGPADPERAAALRLRVKPGIVTFDDRYQGTFAQDVAATCGDFVLKRRDDLHAYHLAVVVDDAAQGVTDVVRGADLLDSTPRQILLYRTLGLEPPSYGHLPLAVDSEGRKLSKSQQSLPIEPQSASRCLWHALTFLHQSPPPSLYEAVLSDLWTWAKAHWRAHAFRGIKAALAPTASNY